MNVYKRLNGLIVLCLAVLLVPSTVRADGEPASGQATSGTLRGVILGPGGKPLAAATVLIHGASPDRTVLSDLDGAFTVRDLTPGTYRITASKQGFSSPSGAEIEVGQNQSSAVMIQFAKADAQPAADSPASTPPAPAVVRAAFGTIAGVVRDAAKRPVADVTVTAIRLDGNGIRTTISNSDGVYSFSDLPAGTYSVMTQADGYADVSTASLQVAAGRPTRTNIIMASTQPEAPAVIAAAAVPAPPQTGAVPASPAPAPVAAAPVNTAPPVPRTHLRDKAWKRARCMAECVVWTIW